MFYKRFCHGAVLRRKLVKRWCVLRGNKLNLTPTPWQSAIKNVVFMWFLWNYSVRTSCVSVTDSVCAPVDVCLFTNVCGFMHISVYTSVRMFCAKNYTLKEHPIALRWYNLNIQTNNDCNCSVKISCIKFHLSVCCTVLSHSVVSDSVWLHGL